VNVPRKRPRRDPLFSTTWVHVFEEDSGEDKVYLPEKGPIPLSRRPRERFRLDPDGSARFFLPGPDDRFVEHPASWKKEDGDLVVRASEGGRQLRIIHQSRDRLVVRRVHATGSR
jgi:hypothetical protein